MRFKVPSAILSVAAGLMFLWHAGGSSAQPRLATGSDASVTAEGLHRLDPSIIQAAWVRPDLDLSRYTRILLMPTAIQFREVAEPSYAERARSSVNEFPVPDERKEWFRRVWRQAVEAEFTQEKSYEIYHGVGADVLVLQGFLVDVVSHIPPDAAVSNYTQIRDPWIVNIVLELRDGTTAELVARTIDRRYAKALLDPNTAWIQTEDLARRWAEVLSERLEELADLGGRGRNTPTWAR